MPGPEFLLGTAPFCSPDPRQCYVTPGYQPTGTESSNCWTGSKVICTFNVPAWKKTAMFDELRREIGAAAENVVPAFQWFGSSPICMAEYCEVFKMGFMPIALDTYGDGSGCVAGEKILGMRPILKGHQTLVDEGRKQCYVSEAEKRAIIMKCLDIGLELLKQLAKAMATTSISPPEFEIDRQMALQAVLGASYDKESTPTPMRGFTAEPGDKKEDRSNTIPLIIAGSVAVILVIILIILCTRS